MNDYYEKLNLIIQKNYQSISSYLSNIYDILSINIDNRDMKYNIEDDFRYFIFYQSSKVIKFCYTKPTINYSIYINNEPIIQEQPIYGIYVLYYLCINKDNKIEGNYGLKYPRNLINKELYKYKHYIQLRHRTTKALNYKLNCIDSDSSRLFKEVMSLGFFLDSVILKNND